MHVRFPPTVWPGEIALISRGTCTFSEKIRSAAGMLGPSRALVVNNVAGDPTAMGSRRDRCGRADDPGLHGRARASRLALIADDGKSTTIDSTNLYFPTTNVDIRAGFSSEGPTDVDFRVKPDVMAPGAQRAELDPGWACEGAPCWAFFQGTSMATPHLAASAAVVRSSTPLVGGRSAVGDRQHGGTERDQKIRHRRDPSSDVNVVGAGRENLLAAVERERSRSIRSASSFGRRASGQRASPGLTTGLALESRGARRPASRSRTRAARASPSRPR